MTFIRKGLLLIALSVLPPGVGAEVVDAGAQGFHIRVAVTLPVDTGAAWEQFVHPERWWNAEHSWFGKRENFSLQPVAGGCLCEIDGEASVMHLTVATAVPGRRMVLLGGLGPLQSMGLHGAATFTFEDLEGGGTRVVHDYRVSGYSGMDLAQLAPVVAAVQQSQLDGLAASFSGP